MTRPTLDETEARVLGALAEKSMATPEQYPLTMNALVAACNQKSAREPVTSLSEREVSAALERLMRRGLAGTTSGTGHRVAKFRHLADRVLGLSQREMAVLTVLLLRGPQTPGELRTRTARLAPFESVEAVEEALWLLADREAPLVLELPRQPGQSALRTMHLLGGEPDPETLAELAAEAAQPAPRAGADLVARVEALEAEVASLREAFEAFRASFE
jgi:uncharacterized protein YceH (UPF0502 family)